MANRKMKKRTQFVKIELRGDVHFNWNKEKKCFELLNSRGEISDKHLVSVGDAYHREGKKPKVLREVKNPTGGIINLQHRSVDYDRYLAIDTSYKNFGGNYICATGSLCIEQHIDHEKGLRKGEKIAMISFPRLIFLAKQGSKPER